MLPEELQHKKSVIVNSITTSDLELKDYSHTGTILVADQNSSVPNGLVGAINTKYFDGQIIRLPQANAPPGSLKSNAESVAEDVTGDKGSVLYVKNVRGRVVGNNPYRELITAWTEKNNNYSVLNNLVYPEPQNDLKDCPIDFEIVPITIGLQVGGPSPSQVDAEDGMGFLKFYKDGNLGGENEICLTLKGDVLAEKFKWHMPRLGPVRPTQVLGLESINGNEAILKWVDLPVYPIFPGGGGGGGNFVPQVVELDLVENVCVTKDGYNVTDVTVQKRSVKVLQFGPLSSPYCITSVTGCCPDPPYSSCYSFSICSTTAIPYVLCARIIHPDETIEDIQLNYSIQAVPGFQPQLSHYIGASTLFGNQSVYLSLGEIQDGPTPDNPSVVGAKLFIVPDNDEELGIELSRHSADQEGCAPFFIEFQGGDYLIEVTECLGLNIDCNSTIVTPLPCQGPVVNCAYCTSAPNTYVIGLTNMPAGFEYLNGAITLLDITDYLAGHYNDTIYPSPIPNQAGSLECGWFPTDQKFLPSNRPGIFLVFSNTPDYDGSYIYVVMFNRSSLDGTAHGDLQRDTLVYYRKKLVAETRNDCCQDYTLDFWKRVDDDYSVPGIRVDNFIRGPFPPTITAFSGNCCGEGHGGGGGGGGGGGLPFDIVTGCCPNGIPEVLTATITPGTNFACASASVSLTYHSGGWGGTTLFGTCGRTATVNLTCSGGFWVCQIGWDDLCINPSLNAGPSSLVCDPLSISFLFSTSGACGATGSPSDFTITVTQ